jgi:hypothetical protein
MKVLNVYTTNQTAHKIESLVKLEAEYGPLPQYSPAIDDVLDYLKEVHISITCHWLYGHYHFCPCSFMDQLSARTSR